MRHLDIAAINAAAGTERRNREVHLPPVSLYRWWARRTESLFGGVLDAFSQDNPGHLLVADPFAGGGVITLAAAMRGHRVYAQDINPWASNGLAAMLNLPEPEAIEAVGERLGALAEPLIRSAYATTFSNGSPAMIAHTLRVATAECSACGIRARLFPHAFVSLVARKERGKPDAFLACPSGHLFLGRIDTTGRCAVCRVPTDPESLYTSRRAVTCLGCGHCETLAGQGRQG